MPLSPEMNPPPAIVSNVQGRKFLTIVLNDETYGLAVINVREIIRLEKITTVPQMPGYVKGVLNLRGRVIPVVDLRTRLGLRADVTERTCIVVVQADAEQGGARQMGLIVDRVEDVVNIPAADIRPPPEFSATIEIGYLLGMATVKGQLKLLLDLDRVLDS